MSNLAQRSATVKDFQALSVLMANQNEQPERQCIHSGIGAEAIYKQMEIYEANGEIVFVLAEEGRNGRICGAFGAEYDEAQRTAWLWGPFALDQTDYQLTEALYETFLLDLPPHIKRLNSYLNKANQWGRVFYEKIGFESYTTAHVYIADKPDIIPLPDDDCLLLPPSFEAQFVAMLDEVFPDAHTKGPAILKNRKENSNRVYVIIAGQELLGYVHAVVDETSNEGYIEQIAVKADIRGQGLGRRLLQTALAWLFDECDVPQVGLNVRENLANARSLYESLGFRLRYTGIAMRKYLV